MWDKLLSIDRSIWLVIAGAILGVALQYAIAAIKEILFYVFARDGNFRVLIGDWHAYHHTTEDGNVVLRGEIWEIRRRPWTGIRVRTRDPERPQLNYAGRISTRPDLICNMRGRGFSETYHLRLTNPIPGKSGTFWGLKVGIDFDSKIFATIYLFSRKPLEIFEAERMLREKITSSIRKEFMNIGVASPQAQ